MSKHLPILSPATDPSLHASQKQGGEFGVEQGMEISDVQITSIHPINGLIAFASCIINGRIALTSIGIHRKLDGSGYRLTYPTKKAGNKDITLFHPLDAELSKAVEAAIFAAYKEQLSSPKLYDRHTPQCA